MDPYFSVIIPVYKTERYLEQCVESIRSQSFKNFEIIMVDDGSPDRCPDMIDQYAKMDARIRTIHKKNEGLSAARNDGLHIAKGNYIIFLDSDDFWDDDCALEKIEEKCSKHNPDLLIFGSKKLKDEHFFAEFTPPELNETGEDKRMECLMRANSYRVCAWDKAYKRRVLESNRIEFVKGQLSEDFEWCIKLLSVIHSVDTLKIPVYVYRQNNPTSITHNVGKTNIIDILQVLENYEEKHRENRRTTDTWILNFLANEYVLWMMLMGKNRGRLPLKDCDQRGKALWSLLDYDWYPYVATAKRMRFVGYWMISRLLAYYREIRKRRTK